MNDIEVGEFVRTNQGHIGVLKRIEFDKNDKSLKWYVFDKKEFEINIIKEEYVNKPYIVKHSKNIIDLIEEGDYVNGREVIIVYGYDENGNDKDELGICEVDGDDAYYLYLEEEDIKSIVTKEQFEQVQYKI